MVEPVAWLRPPVGGTGIAPQCAPPSRVRSRVRPRTGTSPTTQPTAVDMNHAPEPTNPAGTVVADGPESAVASRGTAAPAARHERAAIVTPQLRARRAAATKIARPAFNPPSPPD